MFLSECHVPEGSRCRVVENVFQWNERLIRGSDSGGDVLQEVRQCVQTKHGRAPRVDRQQRSRGAYQFHREARHRLQGETNP